MSVTARRLRISGHVQGVGFRPFVYRLAQELKLAGTVQNLHGEVEVLVQGPPCDIERFCSDLMRRAPALARPQLASSTEAHAGALSGFRILDSAAAGERRVFVPADSFVCAQCLAEMGDPAERRYRYPFINCTQCGPRYTLIEALPYDRARTTMAGFALCPSCRREYSNPADRRFHAEPTACPVCGPSVWLTEGQARKRCEAELSCEAALARAVELLAAGRVLAVKGVGGYHLICDALNQQAVLRLRGLKRRPGKPLAVMFPQGGPDGLDVVRQHARFTSLEAQLLTGPARPIVLVRRRPDTPLAAAIAPGLLEIGAFLPYSPLHQLLLADLNTPLVATSGNVSGEPVQTDPEEAQRVLGPLSDACLHHDRPIARPADDSVIRVMQQVPCAVRIGRGTSPLELALPVRLARPVLAVGGHLKTTIALGFEDRIVISPHIADMGSVRSEQVFAQVIADLQRLYGVAAAEVVCDAHPRYATHRWAQSCGLPVTAVWHHPAHASGLAAQHPPVEQMLVFAWDGAGLGEDGTLWGGETLLGGPGRWRRVASLRPFRLPGGDLAGRAPWRSAAALCWELGLDPPELPKRAEDRTLAHAAWERGIRCTPSSSAGRLFDAASALVLGLHEVSYEGQGPMQLEALATQELEGSFGAQHAILEESGLPQYCDLDGVVRLDWAPLVALWRTAAKDSAQRAWRTHAVLAASIAEVASRERRLNGVRHVGLTGGVFQNALLTHLAHEQLARAGFTVLLAGQVPCNDGGLSHGQIIELAARRRAAPLV